MIRKAVAEVIPKRQAEFLTSFLQAQESVSCIASTVTSSSGADVAFFYVIANVIFAQVVVERYFRPSEYTEQFHLVFIDTLQSEV